jgi:uncharacterized protein YecT (DUF1311 family)
MRSRKSKLAVILLATAWSLPLAIRAQELPGEPSALDDRNAVLKIQPSYQKCLDAPDSGMPSMIRCNQAEYRFQDKRLNDTYRLLAARLNATERKELQREERAWIAMKEKDCAIPEEAGQGDLLDAVTCSVTYTARRATVLEGRLGSQRQQ